VVVSVEVVNVVEVVESVEVFKISIEAIVGIDVAVSDHFSVDNGVASVGKRFSSEDVTTGASVVEVWMDTSTTGGNFIKLFRPKITDKTVFGQI
jgi:hypothetical protein